MAAFLGAHARIRPLRIDEGQHRPAESFGQTEQAQRLAIALGPRHAEVAPDLVRYALAALVADHHDRRPPKACQPADDRRVVGEHPVAVQFHELGAQRPDVIQGVGPVGVAGELDALPRGQGTEHLGLARADFVFQTVQLCLLRVRAAGELAQLVRAPVQCFQRLFEVEVGGLHAGSLHETRVEEHTGRGRRRRGLGIQLVEQPQDCYHPGKDDPSLNPEGSIEVCFGQVGPGSRFH